MNLVRMAADSLGTLSPGGSALAVQNMREELGGSSSDQLTVQASDPSDVATDGTDQDSGEKHDTKDTTETTGVARIIAISGAALLSCYTGVSIGYANGLGDRLPEGSLGDRITLLPAEVLGGAADVVTDTLRVKSNGV